ncbi:hypothetical protein [Psychrobacter sp. JCM 18900]|uniref:hypothetical protein n=1 Tax=Psychrobacter sp. JCM 18900 TaxID=1298608 RepID=UPI0021C39FB5|nr:hypothetical protein [Psychrobacter sp. JCM 18900]
MMIVTTDNTSLILGSNEPNVNKVIDDLSLLASKNIGELVTTHPNLLIFPAHFEDNEDDIASKPIFELKVSESQTVLETGNVMGFIGVKDTQLKIQSRFARASVVDSDDQANQEEAIEEDYFLHYMLQKVLCINLFDLKHSRNQTNLFDYLVYLFPYFLKKSALTKPV